MAELPCCIIKDLLPLHAEGLTGEESGALIGEHLASCESCRKLYGEMTADSRPAATAHPEEDAAAIDFLKKSNRKLRRGLIFGITTVLALCLCLLLARGYLTPHAAAPQMIEITALQVEGGDVRLEGFLSDPAQAVRSVDYTLSEGTLSIELQAGTKLPFTENSFSGAFTASEPIDAVLLAGRVIWENGTEIPDFVSNVYAARHPYLGSMPDNGRSAIALGIPENLGAFTNELQTSAEPYGWTLVLAEDMGDRDAEKLREQLEYDSAMLIATIENLGYVRFVYNADGTAYDITYTEADADAHCGGSVKAAAQTASGLFALMKAW